ncbi:MAG TPA: MYXO-CTERM sorting domain-containing protein [Polyangiaceae bacterium]
MEPSSRSLRVSLGVLGVLGAALLFPAVASAQTVTVDGSKRFQTIDGFGTCLSGTEGKQTWWQQLYYEDLAASMVRVDITPTFAAPYNAQSYCSPWFGQAAPLSLDNGGNGPDGTRTRQYTGPADYSTSFGGCSAPIAVMGTDIDKNAALFDFTTAQAVPGLVAQLGTSKASELGGFELYASMWSPAPWVKITSGNTYGGGASPLPTAGVAWPFIWGGNFAGGKLDVSGTPLSQFDDGTGPTSALTQFTRGLAAFLHGFQKTFNVSFHAISIQNELNFEEFYNSATYPAAADYVTALKAARAELDQYPDLKTIAIIGPEDLMGGDPYGMWQYGSGSTTVAKNLQYLSAIAADPTATSAIGGFNIHGYGSDGTSSAGANSQLWDWWANGWTTSPAGGIPANVKGFAATGKRSWMTETSGEKPEWLASSTSGGFPDSGAFSIAVKIHQALTTGQESAWLYWQLTDGSASSDSDVQTLTDATQLANDPKYVAAKHFFKYVRPGAQRVSAAVSGAGAAGDGGSGGGADGGAGSLLASAFVRDASGALTVVLVNEASADAHVALALTAAPQGLSSLAAYTSANGSYWQTSQVAVGGGSADVTVPGYGVVTLTGTGAPVATPDGGTTGPDAGPISPDGGTKGGEPDASAGGGSDAGAGNGATPSKSSGCGCTTAGGAGGAPWALALLVSLGFGVRRRRARR